MAKSQRQSLLILFIIFGALLAGSAVLLTPRRNPIASPYQTGTPLPTAVPIPYLFPSVLPRQITRIVVEDKRPDAKTPFMIVQRIPGDWRAENQNGAILQADLTKIARVVRVLATLRYNRSIDQATLEAFGLAGNNGFVIRFEADTAYTLYIGNMNPDQTLTYVRRNNESTIWLIPTESAVTLVSALEGWAVASQ
ncbi:MAG: hypothetical protein OHK0023_08540 [Anaerolineae bacterium]